ncbi:MAG: DUF6442 family protein [Candidatus Coproplasma sp.]
MEENEELEVQCLEEIEQNDDGAVAEEINATLSKEEILEASRKENKNGDERERQGMLTAQSLAMSTGLFIGGIVILVSVLVTGKISVEIWLILCGMQTTQAIVNAVKMSKQRVIYIVLSVIFALCFIAFCVLWILEMCGVAL